MKRKHERTCRGGEHNPAQDGSSAGAAGTNVETRKRRKRACRGDKHNPAQDGSSAGVAGTNVETTNPIEDRFLEFFESFKETNDEMKFYRAEAAVMGLKQSSVLRIDYKHLVEHIPDLACALVLETDRITGLIAGAFKRFTSDDNYLHDKEISVYCYNFPEFQRKELLLEFLVTNHPVVSFKLHDGVVTTVCTRDGNTIFQGYINDILARHKEGLTWSGNLEASDMVVLVVNGHYECRIMKQPHPGADHDAMSNDFRKLADILLQHYALSDGGVDKSPPFFTDLSSSLRNIPANVPTDATAMERFVMFVHNHMAFLPSMSRCNLIFNLMRVYKALGPQDKHLFEFCVNNYFALVKSDWRTRIKPQPVLDAVYAYQNKQQQQQKKKKKTKPTYRSSGLELLRFQRNFIVHAVEHLKDAQGNPRISTLEEVEYFLAYHYDKFLVEVMKRLVNTFDMRDLLHAVWMDFTLACSKECT